MLRSDASLLHPIASPYCHSYLDTSMKQLRRLKTAKITLAFEDARCHFRNRPEVVTIAPADNFFINKNADTRDVEQSVNASPNVSATGVAGNLGCDNGVIWNLEEDAVRNAGIPSFLLTSVLLRGRDYVPFQFTIQVETGVDLGNMGGMEIGRNADVVLATLLTCQG
ncbi:hypothetical protein F5X97DRAFT_326022 [Nemania serpens]|nr:hypothetical protein F5X97DRAFT_326022 [Nemania serpens]